MSTLSLWAQCVAVTRHGGTPAKPKRNCAACKPNIVAALKKRWAAKTAAAKTAPAAAKKSAVKAVPVKTAVKKAIEVQREVRERLDGLQLLG